MKYFKYSTESPWNPLFLLSNLYTMTLLLSSTAASCLLICWRGCFFFFFKFLHCSTDCPDLKLLLFSYFLLRNQYLYHKSDDLMIRSQDVLEKVVHDQLLFDPFWINEFYKTPVFVGWENILYTHRYSIVMIMIIHNLINFSKINLLQPMLFHHIVFKFISHNLLFQMSMLSIVNPGFIFNILISIIQWK